MNNPFAPTAAPPAANTNPFGAPPPAPAAAQASANPFAPGAVVLNPGVQTIQAAFAQGAAPAANPFAPVQAPREEPLAQVQAPAFAPLNPPGEAGLGLAAPVVAQPVVAAPEAPAPVEPVVAPDEPAPRARRGRKPRSTTQAVPTTDAAVEARGREEADEAAALDNDEQVGTPTQFGFTTEQLVEVLKSRGYAVTLTDGAP